MTSLEPDVSFRAVDTSVVLIANAINLLVVCVFLARAFGKRMAEHYAGLALAALALPLLFIIVRNAAEGREWWTTVLPGLMVLYLLVELVLDYILKSDFRQTAWLWPYLLLFYAALMGMIGYSFLAGRTQGFITLCTYFAGLAASWFSYSRVGHGQ